MDKCPVCHARLKESAVCRRCKTDLKILFDIKNTAFEHREKAMEYFHEDAEQFHFHAKRACSLMATQDHVKLFACASLASGRFSDALNLWKLGTPNFSIMGPKEK